MGLPILLHTSGDTYGANAIATHSCVDTPDAGIRPLGPNAKEESMIAVIGWFFIVVIVVIVLAVIGAMSLVRRRR